MTPVIFMSFILVLLELLIERAKNMNKPHAGVFFFCGGGGGVAAIFLTGSNLQHLG